MAYTDHNFKTKKAIKDHLAAQKRYDDLSAANGGATMQLGNVMLQKEFPRGRPADITVYNPGLGTVPQDGTVYLEGPHYPAAHTWYAQGKMQNGVLVSVK